jgi:hypothetical protein
MLADLLTKALQPVKHKHFKALVLGEGYKLLRDEFNPEQEAAVDLRVGIAEASAAA